MERKMSMSQRPFEQTVQKLNIDKYDEFFQQLYTPIGKVKSYRTQLNAKEEKLLSASGVADMLQKPTLAKAMKAYVLLMAANHNGDLDSLAFRFGAFMPFISLDSSRLSTSERNVCTSYNEYTDYLTQLQNELPFLQTHLKDKQAKVTQMQVQLDQTMTNQQMAEADKKTAKRAMHNNVELIKETLKQVQHLQEKLALKVNSLKKGSVACENDISLLKREGIKAYEQTLFEPKEVLAQCWPYSKDLIKP